MQWFSSMLCNDLAPCTWHVMSAVADQRWVKYTFPHTNTFIARSPNTNTTIFSLSNTNAICQIQNCNKYTFQNVNCAACKSRTCWLLFWTCIIQNLYLTCISIKFITYTDQIQMCYFSNGQIKYKYELHCISNTNTRVRWVVDVIC